jgi:hypothetical protein
MQVTERSQCNLVAIKAIVAGWLSATHSKNGRGHRREAIERSPTRRDKFGGA